MIRRAMEGEGRQKEGCAGLILPRMQPKEWKGLRKSSKNAKGVKHSQRYETLSVRFRFTNTAVGLRSVPFVDLFKIPGGPVCPRHDWEHRIAIESTS